MNHVNRGARHLSDDFLTHHLCRPQVAAQHHDGPSRSSELAAGDAPDAVSGSGDDRDFAQASAAGKTEKRLPHTDNAPVLKAVAQRHTKRCEGNDGRAMLEPAHFLTFAQ